MSQGNTVLPTVGTVSGLTMTQDANAAMQALLTQNSGATAPTNGPSAAPIKGQTWIDTSVTPNVLNMYDGTSWLIFGYIDTVSHLWKPVIGGGTDTIASAATTDLGSKASGYLTISGVAAITSLGSTAPTGTMKVIRATGAFTLTYNGTSLLLPNGTSNIVAVAGDTFIAVHLGSGNWVVPLYQRADGTAISSSAVFSGAVYFNGGINAAVSTDQNNYAPAGLATANRIFISSTANINISGIQGPATNGQMLLIHNTTGIGTQTLLPASTLSSSSNRFIAPYPVVIRPGNSVALDYDSTGGGWRLAQNIPSTPIAGSYRNLKVINASTGITTSMQITADALTVESTGGEAFRIQNISVIVSSTVSGVNGLDSGSLSPSTSPQWLSEWVIYGSTLNTIAGLLSLSTAAPVMPAGYTAKVRVGWVPVELSTSANRLKHVVQYGDLASYVMDSNFPLPTITSGVLGTPTTNPPSWITQTVSGITIPASAGSILVQGIWAASTILAAPSTSYGALDTSTFTNTAPLALASGQVQVQLQMWSLESTAIAFASNGTFNQLRCAGWRDNLN